MEKNMAYMTWSVCQVMNLSQTWSVYFCLSALLWSKLPVASVITYLEFQSHPSQDTAAVGDVNCIFVHLFETLYFSPGKDCEKHCCKERRGPFSNPKYLQGEDCERGREYENEQICSSAERSIMSSDPAGTLQQKLRSLLSFLLSSYILLFRQVLICASKQISVAFGHRPPL